MKPSTVRKWSFVHKWTSLITTVFLLLSCVTGLPLIFHDEIESAMGPEIGRDSAAADAADLDAIVSIVLAARPGEVMRTLSFDRERPLAVAITAQRNPPNSTHLQTVDLRTGALIPRSPEIGILALIRELHVELLAGLPGTYFLGVMGLLLLVAIVSGVVLYAPFMRRLDFGRVRHEGSSRLGWLDLHNLLGIVTVVWAIGVVVTGVFNTLDRPLARQWQTGQLADMTKSYRDMPPPREGRQIRIGAAVAAARAANPGMRPSLVFYPGDKFSTPHHFNVFMRGLSPVTARLIKPTLVDAETGRVTDTRDMPIHIRALFLSRPLHYGDYGGLPLKIIWGILDIATIVVLVTGLYLWLRRGRSRDGGRRVDAMR